MDDRAWDFLTMAPGHVQEIVVNEFKPRRLDDEDYSAAVWEPKADRRKNFNSKYLSLKCVCFGTSESLGD